jgi:K(+)-stimulated pyrophosphate-energized sodium pump
MVLGREVIARGDQFQGPSPILLPMVIAEGHSGFADRDSAGTVKGGRQRAGGAFNFGTTSVVVSAGSAIIRLDAAHRRPVDSWRHRLTPWMYSGLSLYRGGNFIEHHHRISLYRHGQGSVLSIAKAHWPRHHRNRRLAVGMEYRVSILVLAAGIILGYDAGPTAWLSCVA